MFCVMVHYLLLYIFLPILGHLVLFRLFERSERSFSTRLGNTFGGCARLISMNVCTQAERKYRIRGKESVDPIRVIDNIVNHFKNSGMTMSYLELLKQTPEVSHSPKLNRKQLSDLCVKVKMETNCSSTPKVPSHIKVNV